MSDKRNIQKLINVRSYDGEYTNFFFTPGSINSLQSYISTGWRVIFIKDDPVSQEAVVLLEIEI